jgi:hypothetical protein
MTTVTLKYDGRNKNISTLLDVIMNLGAVRVKKEAKPKSELYHGLNSAFAEVRLMLDGKKKGKSAQEFLEEMRKERANELHD